MSAVENCDCHGWLSIMMLILSESFVKRLNYPQQSGINLYEFLCLAVLKEIYMWFTIDWFQK